MGGGGAGRLVQESKRYGTVIGKEEIASHLPWGRGGALGGGGKIKTTRKGNQVTQIQFLYLMPVISGPASSIDQR